MTLGKWRQATDSEFKARWCDEPDESLGNFGRKIELMNDAERTIYVKVFGRKVPDSVKIECWMENGRQAFMNPDALASITKVLSLSTMRVIWWSDI
jgi:hypothetical protein